MSQGTGPEHEGVRARKARLLGEFLRVADEAAEQARVASQAPSPASLSKAVNQSIGAHLIRIHAHTLAEPGLNATQCLEALLEATYCAQVALVDRRNTVWPYDYMAFSRRMGELWERLVRLAYDHPVTPIEPRPAPTFEEVRVRMRAAFATALGPGPLPQAQRQAIEAHYEHVWALVDSGPITLQLDFHGIIAGRAVHIDFKSGFGSNEKGNTSRLLLAATAIRRLDPDCRTMLLVRSPEHRTNHYFRLLARSGVWEARCGENAYAQMALDTGFDLAAWRARYVAWESDLSQETLSHLRASGLVRYLLG